MKLKQFITIVTDNELKNDIDYYINRNLKTKNRLILSSLILSVLIILGIAIKINIDNEKIKLLKNLQKNIKSIEKYNSNYIYSKTILNWDNIDYWLNHFNISNKEIVKAQIQLEAGKNLNSNIAVKNNNILGMKMAYQREKTSLYIDHDHAGYSSYIECLKDYSLWQNKYWKKSKYYKENDDNAYLNFLKSYAEDKNYINKLKTILKTK